MNKRLLFSCVVLLVACVATAFIVGRVLGTFLDGLVYMSIPLLMVLIVALAEVWEKWVKDGEPK
jgi:hypothetical protein